MVSVLALGVGIVGFESRSGQTKQYIGICCILANNVSECVDISTYRLLIQ